MQNMDRRHLTLVLKAIDRLRRPLLRELLRHAPS